MKIRVLQQATVTRWWRTRANDEGADGPDLSSLLLAPPCPLLTSPGMIAAADPLGQAVATRRAKPRPPSPLHPA
jgi:hypothetical protein